jgi:hypothetical protein
MYDQEFVNFGRYRVLDKDSKALTGAFRGQIEINYL